MNKLLLIGLFSTGLTFGCGDEHPNSSEVKADQLGHTCYSYPYLKHKIHKYNVCFSGGTTQHKGLIGMIAAKRVALRNCIQKNALDYGADAGPGKSCVAQCRRVTYCVPFTSN